MCQTSEIKTEDISQEVHKRQRKTRRVITNQVIFSQDKYCGGYSGEDPPLPIPNREVKLTSADGTALPGGRVGSCHALTRSFETTVSELFLLHPVSAVRSPSANRCLCLVREIALKSDGAGDDPYSL